MYLKKIELNGFKSFADKTSLKILPGITSIVGPNGCGKTNVVDAISWVLGEQRVRLLRGYKMEDVIFSGTSGRQPIGMAEVTLTFDNSDGQLPIEYSEVTIGRRVFRSGESNYLINKTPCRLRDINELILGTGLGNRSYSLVGQGRIDQILQASPEERRGLLEEAAGISRYRSKKQEALRKLENTTNNLLRVDDILREVKRQLSVAERQARQAETYRRRRERLREKELKLALYQLREIRRQAKELGEKKGSWQGKYQSLEEEVEGVEKELLELRNRRREREAALNRLRAEQVEERARIDKAEHRAELNSDRGKELQYQRTRTKEEIEGIAESLEREGGELRQLRANLEEIKKANGLKSTELSEKEGVLAAIRRELSGAEKCFSEISSRSLEISRRDSQLRNELLALQAGGKELVLRQKKLEVEKEGVIEEEEELRAAISEEGPLLKEAEEKARELNEELARQKESVRGLREKTGDYSSRKEEALLGIREREAREELLGEAGPSSLGAVLEASRGDEEGFSGVIGPVSELIEIEPGFESAVRAVLSEMLRTLVVRDWAAARRVWEFLQSADAGPLRIMVLEAAQRSAPAGGGPVEGGVIGKIKLLPPLTGLEGAVFRDAVVVDDITRFFDAAPEKSDGVFVSRQGEAFYPPGVICWAGGRGRSGETDLEELRAELRRLRSSLEEVEAEVERHNNQLHQAFERTEELARNLQQEEVKVALSRREAERQAKTLEKLSLSREAVENELRSLIEEQENAAGRRRELESQLNLKDSRDPDESLEDELASTREKVDGAARRSRKVEAGVTDLKIGLASSREREDSLSGRLDRLNSEIEGLKALREKREREIEEGVEREAELEEECKNLKLAAESSTRQLAEVKERVGALEAEIAELNLKCEEKEKVYQEVRPRFQEVQTHLSSYEVKLAEWNFRDENLCQRMREKYEVELESMEVPDEEIDEEALALEVEKIKKKMGGMTNVNLAALDDKENYEARFKLLTEQKDDLTTARSHIEEAIKKINVTAREKLQKTYEQVRENFQELFAHLFAGGKADLLLNNEADILESGLDIVAQPPGKKLSHLSLLSGGERALTTIALIFSLFKVQPSPFYILDEIDAPLDESNIGRFVKLLRGMTAEAQFIIITHNKRSISAADILYGITMEESGVSKVVSVKLAQHDDDKQETGKNPANDEVRMTNDE